MDHLTKSEIPQISPFFRDRDETMVWSYLQGYMGDAWCDHIEAPTCAQIIVGDFCFFSGTPNLELVQNIPADFPSASILMIPPTPDWASTIEQVYEYCCTPFYRYAFFKDPKAFNLEALRHFSDSIPPGFELQAINEPFFYQAKQEKWSQDLCSQFPDYQTYRNCGLGIVALRNATITSGCSSYTYYNGGIEIEIDTMPEFRRMGLAQACASRLILNCLERSLYPSWDAANEASCALAQKLGYRLQNRYLAYSVSLKHFRTK